MAEESISQALEDECRHELRAALVEVAPLRIEAFARQWCAGASMAVQPANDPFNSMPWTFADRLARVHEIDVIERPQPSTGQYGGAVVSRRTGWIVAGFRAPLRELLKIHECAHILAGSMAWSEGAVWWATLAMAFRESLVEAPCSIAEMYLGATFRFPRWCADLRWWCLEVLDSAQEQAV